MTDSSHNPDRELRPKSLWEVMAHGDHPAAGGRPESQPALSDRNPSPSTRPDPAVPLKSLWELMGTRPQETESEEVTKETVASPLQDEETAAFDMISGDRSFESDVDQSRESKRPHPRVAEQRPAPKRWKKTSSQDLSTQIKIRQPEKRPAISIKSRKAKLSVLLGTFAILLSFLAVLPGMWTKFPALILGFVALFSGFLAADEIRTSRGRQTGMNQALTGMALSMLGMFLGPVLAWSLGGLAMFQSDRQAAAAHLKSLGTAIEKFYHRRQQFPAGGTFQQQPDGSRQPMHGWMTALLPYLGYEQLHDSINHALRFDHAANAQPMRTPVPEFYVAGVSQTTSVKGFAAAHFAGVGGEETDPQGHTVHFGVFDRNSTIFDRDVTDGLSNTMIAGEIPSNFPAWGEPENWRQIGKGLNRDTRGFGSAAGGATLFLMADGSVRRLSPDTDPRVLRAMSTRDGDD